MGVAPNVMGHPGATRGTCAPACVGWGRLMVVPHGSGSPPAWRGRVMVAPRSWSWVNGGGVPVGHPWRLRASLCPLAPRLCAPLCLPPSLPASPLRGYLLRPCPATTVVGMTTHSDSTTLTGLTVVVAPSHDRHGGRVGVVVASPLPDYATVKFADGGDTATLHTKLLATTTH